MYYNHDRFFLKKKNTNISIDQTNSNYVFKKSIYTYLIKIQIQLVKKKKII